MQYRYLFRVLYLSRYLKAAARYGTGTNICHFTDRYSRTVITIKCHAEKIITVLTCTTATMQSVLRIRDAYPGSRILAFTHPGSRIQKQQQKRG
jgi:hypothetical protein